MANKNLEKHFFRLYEEEADALFRFVSFRIADKEKALDIVQESYLRIWKVLLNKTPNNTRAYLYRIARNLLIDEYRGKKEVASLEDLLETGFDIKQEEGVSSHEKLDLERALVILKKLPDKYSEALWLRFVEEWPVKEIAESLDETESNVSVRIHRGLRLFREAMKNNGEKQV